MKRIYLLLIAALIFSAGIYGCDIVDSDYRDGDITIDPPKEGDTIQRILLEDFTGHRCINCPKAQIEARRIHDKYEGRVILLAVHAGETYASPTTEHPYDFRTSVGTELDNYFQVSPNGLPQGMVNRVPKESRRSLYSPEWEQQAVEVLNRKPPLAIKLETSYNSTDKEITANVEIEYYEDGKISNHLALYIAEDSIISYQHSSPKDIDDYEHNHVLRAAFGNRSWGYPIDSEEIKKGDKFTFTYKYKINAENSTPGEMYYWRPEKLRIIAFVHDHQDTYEILQVTEKKLME